MFFVCYSFVPFLTLANLEFLTYSSEATGATRAHFVSCMVEMVEIWERQ